MEEMKQTTVVMTAEEKAEFEAFQREKAKKAAEEKAKNDREMYKQMVDEEIANSIPVLLGISGADQGKQADCDGQLQNHSGNEGRPFQDQGEG